MRSLNAANQQLVEPAFSLACEQRDPERERIFHFGRHFRKHRETSADVESTNRNLDPRVAQFARNIDRPRELIGLHSDQQYDAAIRIALEPPNNRTHRHSLIGLVVRLDIEIDALAEDLPRLRVDRKSVQVRQRTRRHEAAPPLDQVAVVVVMRGFDELDEKFSPRRLVHEPFRGNIFSL